MALNVVGKLWMKEKSVLLIPNKRTTNF